MDIFFLSIGTAKIVTDAVVNSTVFQTSKYVSCYLSMPGGELDTAPLVSAILAAGSFARFSPQRGKEREAAPFQERSFTSQSWTPRTLPIPGWICSVCMTSQISIHFRLGFGESVSPRTKGTANHGQMVILHPPHSCSSPGPLDVSTPALDADQQLDLILVPGEHLTSAEGTSPSNEELIFSISGVAFDTSMGRLGHGKGYYDSFITEYIAKTARSRPFLG